MVLAWVPPLDMARYRGATKENIKPYLTKLKALYNRHQYPPSQIYNMDESGYGIGVTQSSQVLTCAVIWQDKRGRRRKGKVVSRARRQRAGKNGSLPSRRCVQMALRSPQW